MMHSTPQTIFTPFLVVQFHAFHRSVPGFVAVVSATFGCLLVFASVLLVDMSPCESVHDADCCFICDSHGFFFNFLVWLHLGDDALASSRQLLQRCSSATSSGRTSPFFRLREQPNHQNTSICWANADLSCSAVAMTHLTPSDILVHLSCRKS